MAQPDIWTGVLGDVADTNTLPKNPISEDSGEASFRELFPKITGVPISQGGKPIRRKDVNALFRMLGEHVFFIQRGGTYAWSYDATYDKGSVIQKNGVLYIAKVDNTGHDPENDPDFWSEVVEVKKSDLDSLRNDLSLNDASLEQKGLVQLSSVLSDDESVAVTPKAVKAVLDQLTSLSSEVTVAKNDIVDNATNISNAVSDITAIKTKNAEQDDKLTEHETLIGNANSSISNFSTRVSDVENQVVSNNATVQALQSTVSNLNLDTINSDIQGLKQTDLDHDLALSNLSDEVQALKTNSTAGALTDLDNRLGVAEAGITVLRSDMTGVQSGITDANAEIETLKTTVQGVSDAQSGVQSSISDLASTVEELEDSLQGIYSYHVDDEYEVDDIVYYGGKLYRATAQTTGASAPDSNADFTPLYDFDLSAVLARLSTLEGKVAALESESGSESESGEPGEIDSSELSALKGRVTVLEGKVSDLESGSQTDLTSSVNNLDTRVSTLENLNISTSLTSLRSDLTDLSGSVTSLDTRVSALEAVTDESEEEHDLSALESRITALENAGSGSDTSAITSRIDDLEDELKGVYTYDVNENYDTNEVVVYQNDLYVSLQDNNTDIITANSWKKLGAVDTSALEGRISTVESNVSTLQSDVSTAQSDITTLKADVQTLQSGSGSGSGTSASYALYAVDTTGATGADAGLDGALLVYQATSQNAVTGFTLVDKTFTITLNPNADIRRMKVTVEAEGHLGTVNVSDTVRFVLNYTGITYDDDSGDADYHIGVILPIVQPHVDGSSLNSMLGTTSNIAIKKMAWALDNLPTLELSFTDTLRNKFSVIFNF